MDKSIFTVSAEDLTSRLRVYQLARLLRQHKKELRVVPIGSSLYRSLLSRAFDFLAVEERGMSLQDLEAKLRIEDMQHDPPSLSSYSSDEEGFLQLLLSTDSDGLIDARESHGRAQLSSMAPASLLVSFGLEGLHQCAPYAALTGRPVVLFEDLDHGMALLKALPEAVSLFCSLPHDIAFGKFELAMGLLAGEHRSRSVGFFCPFNPELREYMAIKTALFRWYGASSSGDRAFAMITDEELECSVYGKDCVLRGRGLSPQLTAEAVSKPCAYVFVSGHSNGVDMDIGNVVLCARQDFGTGTSPQRAMPCFNGKVCHRKTVTNELMPVGAFRSHILFLENCFGVYLTKSYFDPLTSISYHAAISPTVGAFIGTPGSRSNRPEEGFSLIDKLDHGTTLGRAVAELNHVTDEHNSQSCYSLVLFGDPETTLATPEPERVARLLYATGLETHFSPRRQSISSALQPIPSEFFEHISFFRAVLSDAQQSRRAMLATAVAVVRDDLETLWSFAIRYNKRAFENGRGWGVHDEHLLLKELGNRIAQFQESWMGWFKLIVKDRQIPALITNGAHRYYNLVDGPLGSNRVLCRYCNEQTIVVRRYSMTGFPQATSRCAGVCLNCGPVFDAIGDITSGWILCPLTWERSSPPPLSVALQTKTKTITRVMGCAILEPEYPVPGMPPEQQTVPDPASVKITTVVELEPSATVEIPLGTLQLPASLLHGGYMLNVGLMVNEQWTLLRHFVYLKP